MDLATKKAIYCNLYLLAAADGKIMPAEREYLKRFALKAEISMEQQRKWLTEMHSGNINFRTLDSDEARRAGIAVMARMISVDKEFGPEEEAAYINMGKALGFSRNDLAVALREYWNKDPLETPTTAPSPRSLPQGDYALVITDDLGSLELFAPSCVSASVGYSDMNSLAGVPSRPKLIVFHAATDRKVSSRRIEILEEQFPGVPVTFIARQDQAPQIGYLLERGAKRCFVEPLFPDEIGKAVAEMVGSE